MVLAAAGKSSRFGDPLQKKIYASLGGRALWMHAADAFANRQDVAQLIMVIAPEDKQLFNEKFAGAAAMMGMHVVLGGAERADSVLQGLRAVRDEIEWVAIHDAARPCLSAEWIDRVFAAATTSGAAILATPCHATLKRVKGKERTIEETIPRDHLWLAQTPQVFRKSLLVDAYKNHPAPSQATDDASIVEGTGGVVHVVEGSPLNIKVTTQSDMRFAELSLKALPKSKSFPFG